MFKADEYFNSPQTFSQSFTALGMSTASSTRNVSTEPAVLVSSETQLRCQVPDCSQVDGFSTESALRYILIR
jgi:hypothetical protein